MTTHVITIDETTIVVDTQPVPQGQEPLGTPLAGQSWMTVQVSINGRTAWTGTHTTPTAALSLLSQYLHGWAQLQTPEVDRRHQWSGWAEQHADHVKTALGAMDRATTDDGYRSGEFDVLGQRVRIDVRASARYEVRENPEVDPRALDAYPDQRYCVWDTRTDSVYRVDLSGSHPHDAASVRGGAPRFGPVSRESAQEMADHLNATAP